MDLPDPHDPVLDPLGLSWIERGIYEVLFEAVPEARNIDEIRARLLSLHADGALEIYKGVKDKDKEVGQQQHLDRRLRQLDYFFLITRVRFSMSTYYALESVKTLDPSARRAPISKTLRAQVLRNQRCAQCGRTPDEDNVKLHVDHKVPKEWGGSDEIENLQALCSECNEGKKHYFESLGADTAEGVLEAANLDSPHRRIAEALRAAYPHSIRTDVLEAIAQSKQYQEDWQKRLRELRELDGWEIGVKKAKEGRRFMTYYYLKEDPPPLPQGNLAAEIRRLERMKKASKKD